MKATIKVNKLPDIPREPTKAKRIDVYVDSIGQYMMPMDARHEHDKEQREAVKQISENKRGKDKAKRKQVRPWTEEDISTMMRMHREGHSHREIAAALGRSKGNVSNRLKMAREGRLW